MRINHIPTSRIKTRFQFFALITIFIALCSSSHAAPLLRCLVNYAGTTHTIETGATLTPYEIASVNIGERFRFKAVMVGTDKHIDYVKLYAYFQTRHNDIPIHQATYLPPFITSTTPVKLTPLNSLYAGEVERELQYQCTLQEVAQ